MEDLVACINAQHHEGQDGQAVDYDLFVQHAVHPECCGLRDGGGQEDKDQHTAHLSLVQIAAEMEDERRGVRAYEAAAEAAKEAHTHIC